MQGLIIPFDKFATSRRAIFAQNPNLNGQTTRFLQFQIDLPQNHRDLTSLKSPPR
jgi:hypothetical protein